MMGEFKIFTDEQLQELSNTLFNDINGLFKDEKIEKMTFGEVLAKIEEIEQNNFQ